MQRGYIILIIGAALLISGIIISVLWVGSFAHSFIRENTIVGEVSIKPAEIVNVTMLVTDLGRPVSLAIHFQPSSNITLREMVRDPNGSVVSSNEFTGQFFTSFKPDTMGKYTLTIFNVGTIPVSISALFGYLPFVAENNDRIDFNTLSGIIVGISLFIIGIIALIVGVIIILIDRRKRARPNTSII